MVYSNTSTEKISRKPTENEEMLSADISLKSKTNKRNKYSNIPFLAIQDKVRKNVVGITIDEENSFVLDQGINIEQDNKGRYTLEVSISDPSTIVFPGSNLDHSVIKNYLSLNYQYMLKHHFRERLTLNRLPPFSTPTNTLKAYFDEKNRVEYVEFFKSIFYNTGIYYFSQYKGKEDNLGFSKLLEMREILSNIRGEQFGNRERKVLGETEESVREIMLFTNSAIGELISQNYGKRGIYLGGFDTKTDNPYYSNNKGVIHTCITATRPLRMLPDYIASQMLSSILLKSPPPYSEEFLKKIIYKINSQ